MQAPSLPTAQSGTSAPIAAALLAIAIWGATPAVTLVATGYFAPADVAMLRTVLSAALLAIVVVLWRLPLPRSRMGWAELAISAFAGFAAYPLLLSFGIVRTTTSHAALILAVPPVITGLIGFALARKVPPLLWIAGGAMALAGEAVLVLSRSPSGGGTASLGGDLIIALSALVVSVAYVAGGRLSARIGTWAATAWSVILAGLVMAPFSAGAIAGLYVAPMKGLMAIAFLVIGVTIIGYACWYFAIGRAGPQKVAPLQFGQPIFSLIIAVAVLSETITFPVIIAATMVLAGVFLCRKALD